MHASDRVDSWKQQRDAIWENVVRDAWSEEASAFTQYIGSTPVDAANLMMAIVGRVAFGVRDTS
jgi:GH15 family glucan-1,4-alpha-glucosidase